MFCYVNTADSQMTHETYTFTLRANVYSVLEVNRASLSFFAHWRLVPFPFFGSRAANFKRPLLSVDVSVSVCVCR